MTVPQVPDVARLGAQRLVTLRMVANGLSSVQIAKRMGRSRDAVDNDMRAITAALGVSSRTHAVAVAIRLGLIQLEEIDVPAALNASESRERAAETDRLRDGACA